MVFSPTYHRDLALCANCSLLSITSDDGIELEGVIYEPKNTRRVLLVFLGRNHDAVGVINKLAQEYPDYRIVTFNYRSYGKSEGQANEKNILSDALKVAQLVEKHYGSFYILGFSLGSSVAAYVAGKHDVKALFLVGAFDSITSLAKSKFSKIAWLFSLGLSKILRYSFPTDVYVKSVKADTYLFVSVNDKTTYIQNARALKANVQNMKLYLEFDGLTHKEILWDETIVSEIRRIING